MENVHFIGIGGIGMSGLAAILLEKGNSQVSGSDLAQNANILRLQNQGAKIVQGHSAVHLPDNATIIVSSDIPKDNPELQRAKRENRTIKHRSDLLLELMQEQEIIIVSGTHGKTTTSALLSHVMAETDPSFAVGGILLNTGTNAKYGKGRFFVAEADESDGTFLKYPYFAAILTNIDSDHLAHYGSFDNLKAAFSQFAAKRPNPELFFYCGDDPILKTLCKDGISYGFSENNVLHITDTSYAEEGIYFSVCYQQKEYKNIFVPLYGKHNVLNSAAVFGMVLALGLSENSIRTSFAQFKGVKKRLERKSCGNQALIFDDYAHHPTAITHTLSAVRQAVGERRIIAIYQPHRPSRMRHCMHELQGSFKQADIIIVTDLYHANEPLSQLDEEIKKIISSSHPGTPYYAFSRNTLVDSIMPILRPHDVAIFLGAGDISAASDQTAERVKHEKLATWKLGVICGGMNGENKISQISGNTFFTHLDKEFYSGTHFYIDTDGHWHLDGNEAGPLMPDHVWKALNECEIFVPALHGPRGEDGTIQGFLETLHKPYVGCLTKACAVAMDKVMTKQILHSIGIPVAPYIALHESEWDGKIEPILESFPGPYYVKPAHLGSSVGIEYVIDTHQLKAAIDKAFSFDEKLIIEQEVRGNEFKVAVLGNDTILAPPPGEVCSSMKFADYSTKYGNNGLPRFTQANLPEELITAVQHYSKQAYRALDCSGLTRMDWFLDEDNQWWFNEAQPFPGFTSTRSFFPTIWQNEGLPMEELIKKLIILSLAKFRKKERKTYQECSLGKQLETLCVL